MKIGVEKTRNGKEVDDAKVKTNIKISGYGRQLMFE